MVKIYIIVAGIGRVGYAIAKSLCEKNHDLVLIDKDKKVCEEIASELDVIIINGDCSDNKILKSAGIEEAHIYIATTGYQEINLISSLIAKDYGVNKIITRVSNPEYKKIFEKFIDIVISPELVTANYIDKLIDRPGILDLAIIGHGDAEILELIINKNSEAIGKKLKELKRNGYLVIAVYGQNELIIPDGETILKEGDRIIVLSKKESLNNVRKLFI